jgi:hypothetical protein
MNLPPAMIELFLLSSGAPKEVLEIVRLVQSEGFSAFNMKPMREDDPNWAKFGERQGGRTGFWLTAEGESSRALVGIFLEGVNDEVLEGISALAGDREPLALPAAS